jgi:hypothetical protein
VSARVAGNDDRSSFVTLTEDLHQYLGAGRREREVARFIDDKKLVTSELTVEAQETLFIVGFAQLVD